MRDGRLIVVSPHLDDAVLGCGRLLAARPGSTVITVCAGSPPHPDRLTDWDAACGFSSAGQAIAERRREDSAALYRLGADPRWLDHLDDQYAEGDPAESERIEAMAAGLRREIDAADPRAEALVVFPLGLFHPDHRRVHLAMRSLLADAAQRDWFLYEDALYRRLPGLVQQRLAELAAEGIGATVVQAQPGSADAKWRATRCYRSQLRGLAAAGWPDHLDALVDESYWHASLA